MLHNPSFITIRTTRSPEEADRIIQALRARGIHPLELTTVRYVSLAGTDFSFPIEVPDSEASSARDLLRRIDHARN